MQSHITRWLGRLLAAATLLFGGAGTALAQTIINGPTGRANGVWTVYAFGNAQAIADAFRGIANFTSSSTFQNMVLLIAIIGIVSVGAASGFSSAVARKFVGYIVMVMLIAYVLFGVKANGPLSVRVEVYDTVDATWVAPVTVPAVVGIPASMISTAGFQIMRQIEASFPLPDELKMSNGAPFNLATALINDASQAKITDSNLSSSLAMYVQDCFIPAVARGDKEAATLLVSTNFIEDLRYENPALLVNSFLPAGQPNLVNCGEAHTLIRTAVDNSAGGGSGASGFLTNASAWARTPALNVVNSAADSVAQWATNNGITDGAALVKQSAVLASFSGAFRQSAAQTGNSDFLTGLAITQANQSQVNSWVTGAEVFNRVMGYIFAVLQVFVYAITPLILAAALIPSLGVALLKNFVQILLWLAIWNPMLAIVNFIIISMQQADLGGILNSGGSYGFSLANMAVITEKTSNMRAAATFVGTMVPALAWAMVKGSIDVSRVIGSAVGENFAQGASNTMTTGNYSLNSASMDSFTANKHSLGQTMDAGRGFSSATSGGINNKNDLGGNFDPSSGDNKAGVSTRADIAAGRSSQSGTAANAGLQGAEATMASITNAMNRTTSDSLNATATNTAGTQNTLMASANLNGNMSVPLTKPDGSPSAGGQPGAGGSPGGGQQVGANGQPAATKIDKGFKVPKIDLGVQGNIQGSSAATLAKQDATARSHGDASTAAQGATGSVSVTGQRVAGHQETASTGVSANRNQSLAVTSLAPQAEQAAVHQQALHFQTGRFKLADNGGDDAAVFYQGAHSPAGRAAEELSTSGHVVNTVAAMEKTNATKEAALAKKGDDLSDEAKAKEAALKKKTTAEMAGDKQELESQRGAAFVSPSARVYGAAKDKAEAGAAWISGVAGNVADMAPSMERFNQLQESVKESGRQHVESLKGHATPTQGGDVPAPGQAPAQAAPESTPGFGEGVAQQQPQPQRNSGGDLRPRQASSSSAASNEGGQEQKPGMPQQTTGSPRAPD